MKSLSVALKSVNAIYQVKPTVEVDAVELIDSAPDALSAALYKPFLSLLQHILKSVLFLQHLW